MTFSYQWPEPSLSHHYCLIVLDHPWRPSDLSWNLKAYEMNSSLGIDRRRTFLKAYPSVALYPTLLLSLGGSSPCPHIAIHYGGFELPHHRNGTYVHQQLYSPSSRTRRAGGCRISFGTPE
ncbi:hypothetical protein M378DRAFT_501363 [Amanita muscaria Koide BX008]|uniref:Uncharacterized protein n=1 Tax=Amanita muscaria (strain Koide BX008) TaxID=946122 RepID=A0A0C2XN03_AMAMK|nr:hypothetical protein M378DRAFT_501363 [Amanita muscaria Koide BX008]